MHIKPINNDDIFLKNVVFKINTKKQQKITRNSNNNIKNKYDCTEHALF